MTNYKLKLNDEDLFFFKLEGVRDFLVMSGVEGGLEVEDGVVSLDELESIAGEEIKVYNEELVERGDDYVDFCLSVY